jgi:hypothetical protein
VSARRIDLAAFGRGTPHLTPAACAAHAEAAVVCLEHQRHRTGVSLQTDGAPVEVVWNEPDPRAAGTHHDLQDATESGAVALAIELVRLDTGLEVVRRSRKKTGFDYHLGPPDAVEPFDGTHCLEVSGVLDETDAVLERRLAQKLEQVRRGGTGVPGYAVVIGFHRPASRTGALE